MSDDGDRADRAGDADVADGRDRDGDRPTDAELARKRPRTPVARLIALMVLGVGVPAAGLALAWKSCTRGVTGGRVDVAGSTLGGWRATLDRCTSLAPQGLRAVELGHGDNARTLVRVEIDPLDGPIVSLWPTPDATRDAPGGDGAAREAPAGSTAARDGAAPIGAHPIVIRHADCPGLAAHLRSLDSSDDDAPERFDGKLTGTCPLPGGGTVTVDAWWRGCGG